MTNKQPASGNGSGLPDGSLPASGPPAARPARSVRFTINGRR